VGIVLLLHIGLVILPVWPPASDVYLLSLRPIPEVIEDVFIEHFIAVIGAVIGNRKGHGPLDILDGFADEKGAFGPSRPVLGPRGMDVSDRKAIGVEPGDIISAVSYRVALNGSWLGVLGIEGLERDYAFNEAFVFGRKAF